MVIRGISVVLVMAVVVILGRVDPAAAHSEFDTSSPADGATVESPVSKILVRFTEPVTVVAGGFEVLTPDGLVVAPTLTSDDGIVWTLVLDSVEPGGLMAVRYEVAADDDGHILTGGFSFEVDGPPAPRPPGSSADGAVEEFLDGTDEDGGPEAASGIGRRVEFVALLLAIGLTTLAVGVVPDRSSEVGLLFTIVAFLGGALLLGAALEAYGLVRAIDGSVLDALRSSALTSPLLRLGASAMILPITSIAGGRAARHDARHQSGRTSTIVLLAITGLAIGVLSFGFDGHTVSRGPRLIHGLSNAIHVTAAGVWFGGLVGLALLIHGRVRNGAPASGGWLFIRFSSIAAGALVAVVTAGATMAFFIIDRWGDLTSTVWGQRFALKLALASLAIGIGAYNHFRLSPLLRQRPDDHGLLERSLRTVAVEAAVLLFVAGVTATMVAVSSS